MVSDNGTSHGDFPETALRIDGLSCHPSELTGPSVADKSGKLISHALGSMMQSCQSLDEGFRPASQEET